MGFYFYFYFYFPQLPTLFPPGKGPFASLARVSIHHHFYLLPLSPPTALGGSLSFTYSLFGAACLKTEELRWGSPTATPPFEPLMREQKGSPLASSLTVAKEARSLSLSKGPFPNSIFIPSLTLPALKDMFFFPC